MARAKTGLCFFFFFRLIPLDGSSYVPRYSNALCVYITQKDRLRRVGEKASTSYTRVFSHPIPYIPSSTFRREIVPFAAVVGITFCAPKPLFYLLFTLRLFYFYTHTHTQTAKKKLSLSFNFPPKQLPSTCVLSSSASSS